MADKMTPEKWHAYYLELWSDSDQAMYRRCIDVDRMAHVDACRTVNDDRATRLDERIIDADKRVRARYGK